MATLTTTIAHVPSNTTSPSEVTSPRAVAIIQPRNSNLSTSLIVQDIHTCLRECMALSGVLVAKKTMQKDGDILDMRLRDAKKQFDNWGADLNLPHVANDPDVVRALLEYSTAVQSAKLLLNKVKSSRLMTRPRFKKKMKKVIMELDRSASTMGVSICYIKAKSALRNVSKLGLITGFPDYADLDIGEANELCVQADKHFFGYGVTQNYEAAFRVYTAAANLGSAKAEYNIGVMYSQGLGCDRNMEQAVQWITRAADKGELDAINHLGMYYESGESTLPQDFAKAVEMYQKAADKGHNDARTNLGYLYEIGCGVEKNYERAAYWYRLAAENNYAKAQNNLGSCYYRGLIGAKTPMEHQRHQQQRRPELGDGATLVIENSPTTPVSTSSPLPLSSSSASLSARFNNDSTAAAAANTPVQPDYESAVMWFRKSKKQGNPRAMNNLGICYEEGKGVVQDLIKAAVLYRKAAQQGHVNAMNNLGYLKLRQKEYQEAKELFVEAAERGCIDAAYNLGTMYLNGFAGSSIEHDDVSTALKLFIKAADRGHMLAQRRAADILYSMALSSGSCIADSLSSSVSASSASDLLFDPAASQLLSQAASYYGQAALQGDTESMNNLGVMYEEGLIGGDMIMSPFQRYQEAIRWYERSAKCGNPDGLFNLGLMYEQGLGCEVDIARARALFTAAAREGHAQARMHILDHYSNSDGVNPLLSPRSSHNRQSSSSNTTTPHSANNTPSSTTVTIGKPPLPNKVVSSHSSNNNYSNRNLARNTNTTNNAAGSSSGDGDGDDDESEEVNYYDDLTDRSSSDDSFEDSDDQAPTTRLCSNQHQHQQRSILRTT